MTQEQTKKINRNVGVDTSESPVSEIPKIDFIPHTVFLLCGPTYSGKSTFAEDLAYLAEEHQLTFKLLSSDGIRRKLLTESKVSPLGGYGSESRYSDGMNAVSKQAFDILMNELRVAVSYPVSTEIIVVDTTAMNEKFRTDVREIVQSRGYKVTLVTFEYKYRSDYLPENSQVSSRTKDVIQESVVRFRTKVMPSLLMRDFDGRLRIKSRNSFGWDVPRTEEWWDDNAIDTWVENAVSPKAIEKLELNLSCEQLDYAKKFEGDDNPVYAVIGDSHECTKELKLLVDLIKKEHPASIIVHIGDYLDKGGDTVGMIEYMYERLGAGDIILQGNHEAYVVRKLRGEIEKNSMSAEQEAKFFSSLAVLEKEENKEIREKLFNIYDSSKPFALLCDYDEIGGSYTIVTHAPCSNKYLGKVHDDALRFQRNYRVNNRDIPWMEELDWLYKEADMSHPLHIFGHAAHKVVDKNRGYRFKNKVFLDSGAVYGGDLSAAIVQHGRLIRVLSIPCESRAGEEVLPQNLGYGPQVVKKFNIYDYDLDARDLRLLKQVEEKGISYISGTMAPAPSVNGQLEPLNGALDWFKKLGVSTVILEPKYMGSRCQMYLFKDGPEKTFATSRAGWIIKGVHGKTEEEYKAFLASVWEEHKGLVEAHGDMVLDGELLPWYALGSGLIEQNFNPYKELIRGELNTLNSDEGFADLAEFFKGLEFDVESKLGHLAKFEEALDRYGKPGEPQFKGFNVLKTTSGVWENLNHLAKFSGVNDDVPILVDLTNSDSYERAGKYFDTLTLIDGFEGVVVKPLENDACDLPYLKVRSPEYLRIVYGYDYLDPRRYDRLVRQKNISGKVRLSISEHKAAVKMLTAEGDEKKELAVKMIGQMKEEQTLDPRL